MLLTLLVLVLVAVVLALPTLARGAGTAASPGVEAACGAPSEGAPATCPTPAASDAPSSGRASCCARASTTRSGRCTATSGSSASTGRRTGWRGPGATARTAPAASGYAYLIYPHKPVVAFVPATRQLLSEYCVEFPDLTSAVSRSRLPDSDDVLAKWMALTGDERR